ncbi:MAG: Crp/Fnr family transcriptional regulator [Candidatus Velthaea sp.]
MTSGHTFGNRLLDALSPAFRETFAAASSPQRIEAGDITHESRHLLGHVDFPIDAVLSIIATDPNGDTSEVGAVGREAFVEVDAALESRFAERTSICQVAGSAVRVPLEAFRTYLETNREFARLVRRSVRARAFVTEQIASCNANHTIIERLARWLLTLRFRTNKDAFAFTHEALAETLAVRRAGVSTIAATLRNAGAIDYSRGAVRIVDVDRLAEASCECYPLSVAAIERSFLRQDDER